MLQTASLYNESIMYRVPASFGCAIIDAIFSIQKRPLMEKGVNKNGEGYMQKIPRFEFYIFSLKKISQNLKLK